MKRGFIITRIRKDNESEYNIKVVLGWLLDKQNEYKLKYLDMAYPSLDQIQLLLRGSTHNTVLFTMDFVNKFGTHYTIR